MQSVSSKLILESILKIVDAVDRLDKGLNRVQIIRRDQSYHHREWLRFEMKCYNQGADVYAISHLYDLIIHFVCNGDLFHFCSEYYRYFVYSVCDFIVFEYFVHSVLIVDECTNIRNLMVIIFKLLYSLTQEDLQTAKQSGSYLKEERKQLLDMYIVIFIDPFIDLDL